MSPSRFPLLRAVLGKAVDTLAMLADAHAIDAGRPIHPLAAPMLIAALLLGMTLSLVAFQLPRAAIVTLVLSLAVVLAVLRDFILTGDR